MTNEYIRISQDYYSLIGNEYKTSNTFEISKIVGANLYPSKLKSNYKLTDLDNNEKVLYYKAFQYANAVTPDLDELYSLTKNVAESIKPFIYINSKNDLIICSPFLAFLLGLSNNKYEDWEDFADEPEDRYDLNQYFTKKFWDEKVDPKRISKDEIYLKNDYPGEFIMTVSMRGESGVIVKWVKIKELKFNSKINDFTIKKFEEFEEADLPAGWVIPNL